MVGVMVVMVHGRWCMVGVRVVMVHGRGEGGDGDNLLFGKDEFKLTVEQEEKFIENMSKSL